MKLTSALLFSLISFSAHSQYVAQPNPESGLAMGLSGGYSSKQGMIGNFSLGGMFKTTNHISVNVTVLSQLKNTDVPTIGELRFGHFFNTFELYGGAGYHVAGSDNKIASNPNTGIRPAFGVIKHFISSPWTLSAGMSGKVVSLQLGLFGVR